MKKIAIHHRPSSFSDRWISYCDKKKIPYKIVNAFDNDIIQQLHDCNVLMWHHNHAINKDTMVAKKILFALEHASIRVFPDFKTGWHFDDKVAQKYLLEAIDAPLVPSYVFYDKEKATNWAKKTNYPKVFKLRGGAGASNVRLVKSKDEALKLINKAFGKGFSQYDRVAALSECYRKFKEKKESFIYVLKGLVRFFISTEFSRKKAPERGYIYFQDFVPNNKSDLRIIIIGDKAFAVKRLVRENDFRASGSGAIEFDRQSIDERCVSLAFNINKKINAQSVAYDFIHDKNGLPLIVEISYGFAVKPYDKCPGYWDKHLNWHEESFTPQEWMIEQLINNLKKN
ncbi:ATP-grasp domain-containing protein [Advenella sp. RU8]|uniref:ATP-grasp domain-containing protein n=1 Tax=Advenella sp. RU8 TaxID=3399575 RepID=UPI003AADC4E5